MFVYTRNKNNDTCVVSVPVLAVMRLAQPGTRRVEVPDDIPVYLKFGQPGPFSSEDDACGECDKVFIIPPPHRGIYPSVTVEKTTDAGVDVYDGTVLIPCDETVNECVFQLFAKGDSHIDLWLGISELARILSARSRDELREVVSDMTEEEVPGVSDWISAKIVIESHPWFLTERSINLLHNM